MDINVETAKRMLKEEVENAPYVIEESFGNAGTYRKLISFFVAVVKDDTVSREDAKEWLCYEKIFVEFITCFYQSLYVRSRPKWSEGRF